MAWFSTRSAQATISKSTWRASMAQEPSSPLRRNETEREALRGRKANGECDDFEYGTSGLHQGHRCRRGIDGHAGGHTSARPIQSADGSQGNGLSAQTDVVRSKIHNPHLAES